MVITQVGQFPRGKHDDLVDTVSMSLRHLRDLGMLVMANEHRADIQSQAKYNGKDAIPLYPT
jgi:hypothetical protein